jgi:hypothetical protein
MAQFWKRFLAGVTTICRMIFLVCAGDIGIIISAVFVAFLTTNIAGVVLSASDVTGTARTEIAIVVPILTIDIVLLGSILLRIREVAQPDRQHRSLIYALATGLVLLLLKSAWQGLDQASYSFFGYKRSFHTNNLHHRTDLRGVIFPWLSMAEAPDSSLQR